MRFDDWLRKQIKTAGGLNAFARVMDVNASTAMAWRDGRVFPLPDMVTRLAVRTGEDPVAVHWMVNVARMEKAFARRRLAPEVEPARPSFRPRRSNGGAAAQAAPTRRPRARTEAQGIDGDRRPKRVRPDRLRSVWRGGRLIGHREWPEAA